MKIGILTQPLKSNYGGILQAYALQNFLNNLGHDTIIINLQYSKIPIIRKIGSIIKQSIYKYILRKKVKLVIWPNNKEEKAIYKNLIAFTKKMKMTKEIYNINEISNTIKEEYDCIIIGSDQVWRPKYSPNITTYYLDFLYNDNRIIKLSYAASFGVEEWEYSKKLTKQCKKYIKKFDHISVREFSGINLCNEFFNIEAINVLDPTFLLSRNEYKSLSDEGILQNESKYIMTYILDINQEKNDIIKLIEEKLNLKSISILPSKKYSDVYSTIDDCVYPSIQTWIKNIMNAEFVITDSFHGTVLSIIFNKQFISISNKSRGETRFTSLLKSFNLEDKLITCLEDLNETHFNCINYNDVNKIIEEKKTFSINFLKNTLNSAH